MNKTKNLSEMHKWTQEGREHQWEKERYAYNMGFDHYVGYLEETDQLDDELKNLTSWEFWSEEVMQDMHVDGAIDESAMYNIWHAKEKPYTYEERKMFKDFHFEGVLFACRLINAVGNTLRINNSGSNSQPKLQGSRFAKENEDFKAGMLTMKTSVVLDDGIEIKSFPSVPEFVRRLGINNHSLIKLMTYENTGLGDLTYYLTKEQFDNLSNTLFLEMSRILPLTKHEGRNNGFDTDIEI